MTYKKYKWAFAILLILFIGVLNACKHNPVIPDTPQISFQGQVEGLIRNNCASSGCHDGYGHQAPLVFYGDIIQYVTPYNAQKSDIYQRITQLNGDGKMPINGRLSESQILLIYTWIMQGAQNN